MYASGNSMIGRYIDMSSSYYCDRFPIDAFKESSTTCLHSLEVSNDDMSPKLRLAIFEVRSVGVLVELRFFPTLEARLVGVPIGLKFWKEGRLLSLSLSLSESNDVISSSHRSSTPFLAELIRSKSLSEDVLEDEEDSVLLDGLLLRLFVRGVSSIGFKV